MSSKAAGSTQTENPTSLCAALCQIAADYTPVFLCDGNRMISMFTDLAPEMRREHRLLKYFVEAGGHTSLFNVKDANPEDQLQSMEHTVRKMVDEFFVAEDAARLVCEAYWTAVSGKKMCAHSQSEKAHTLADDLLSDAASPAPDSAVDWAAIINELQEESEFLDYNQLLNLTISNELPPTVQTSFESSYVRQQGSTFVEDAKEESSRKTVGLILSAFAVCLVMIFWFSGAPKRERNRELKQIYREAEALYNTGNYENVLVFLADHQDAMSEREGIQCLYEKSYSESKTDILASISDYMNRGHYSDAFLCIDSVVPQMAEDVEILGVRRELAERYKLYLFEQADVLTADGTFDTAREVLMDSETFLGTDEEILLTLKEIDVMEATSIVQAHLSASEYLPALQYLDNLSAELQSEAQIIDLRENVLEPYRFTIYVEADKARAAGEYDAARRCLEAATPYFPDNSDFAQLLNLIDEQEAQSIVADYTAKRMYGEAVKCLEVRKNIVSASAELQELLDSCKGLYRTDAVERAEQAYSSDGYQAAVSILDEALEIMKGDRELTDLRNYYYSRKPIILVELQVFSYGDGGEYNASSNEYKTDRYGNEYSSSFSVENQSTIKWLLKGQYRTFTGTIACPANFQYKNNLSNVVVTVIGDGKVLFTSAESGPDEKPQCFSIDVTAVEELQIKWVCLPALNIWRDWCEYATIFDGTFHPADV